MEHEDSNNLCKSVYSSESKSNSKLETKKLNRISTCVRLVIRPLRIFQFLVVLLIFVLIIYTISLGDSTLPSITCILLIVLAGVYVFVLSIDLISQFIGGELNTTPMFLFSLLGTIFFAIAGILLLLSYSSPWYIITIACLSLFAFILFIIEVSVVLAFWKRTCNLCRQCCYAKPTEVLFQKETCGPLSAETVKHDLMTSISSIKVPYGEEDAVADHSHRKVSFGHRRQYVDCPTSARSLCYVEAADVQTDHQQTLSRQCQTQREVKEMPVQTVSRCELCNRAVQFFASSSAVMQPTIQQAPCAPCPAFLQLLRGTTCCTGCRCVTGIIQVSQQSQQQQTQRVEQSKQDKEMIKEQTDRVQSAEKKSYNMLTSTQHEAQDPDLRGVSETKITKFTLGSYCVMPKTHISCQTASKTAKKGESEEVKKVRVNAVKKEEAKKKKNEKDEKKKVKPTGRAKKSQSPQRTKLNKDVDPSTDKPEKSFKETDFISKNPTVSPTLEMSDSLLEATDSQLENIHKLNPVESKVLIPPTCQVAETINRLQEIENQSRTKPENPSIIKGNKEDDKQRKIDADQEDKRKSTLTEDSISMDEVLNYTVCLRSKENVKKTKVSDDQLKKDKSTIEQALETDSESQSQAETQTTHTEMTNSATRMKRMYGFRKNNKVEPTKLSYTEVNIQTPDYCGSSNPRKIETAEELAEQKQINPERKVINICPVCNKTQVPVSPSSLQYYTAHKDKQERLYCEYCATPNTIKGLSKGEQKRLKCTGCGEYLRTKSSQNTRDKSDNCPQCASIPTPAQSSVLA
ncbi:uncharacterized protein LOC122574668 isoform X2 [Bombus pyrosoma]|uniref:uncharacterized protein LOC122574668 isoform X2 n=1 Tax=Bombus pyrosoma TaxID=396416 RepID=UPI001CB88FD2|nr:uncharacterized protein LOC122574668 isoform X2 [Bombus pyrosoma]